LEGNYTSD